MSLQECKMAETRVFCHPNVEIINRVYDELANWVLAGSYQINGHKHIFFEKGVVPDCRSLTEYYLAGPVIPR